MVPSHPRGLSVLEVATLLGTHPEVVRRWLRQGRLQGSKLGRSWRIPSHALPALEGDRYPRNRFEGVVRRIDRRSGITWIDVAGNRLAASAPELQRGGRVRVHLGAEAIFLSQRLLRGISARNQWPGTVTTLLQRTSGVEVHLSTQPPLVVWVTPDAFQDLELHPGRRVVAVFKAGACRVEPLESPLQRQRSRRSLRKPRRSP